MTTDYIRDKQWQGLHDDGHCLTCSHHCSIRVDDVDFHQLKDFQHAQEREPPPHRVQCEWQHAEHVESEPRTEIPLQNRTLVHYQIASPVEPSDALREYV